MLSSFLIATIATGRHRRCECRRQPPIQVRPSRQLPLTHLPQSSFKEHRELCWMRPRKDLTVRQFYPIGDWAGDGVQREEYAGSKNMSA